MESPQEQTSINMKQAPTESIPTFRCVKISSIHLIFGLLFFIVSAVMVAPESIYLSVASVEVTDSNALVLYILHGIVGCVVLVLGILNIVAYKFNSWSCLRVILLLEPAIMMTMPVFIYFLKPEVKEFSLKALMSLLPFTIIIGDCALFFNIITHLIFCFVEFCICCKNPKQCHQVTEPVGIVETKICTSTDPNQMNKIMLEAWSTTPIDEIPDQTNETTVVTVQTVAPSVELTNPQTELSPIPEKKKVEDSIEKAVTFQTVAPSVELTNTQTELSPIPEEKKVDEFNAIMATLQTVSPSIGLMDAPTEMSPIQKDKKPDQSLETPLTLQNIDDINTCFTDSQTATPQLLMTPSPTGSSEIDDTISN